MLEISHLGDAPLRLQQILRVGRRQRQKRDRTTGLRRRNRADERQMPDDVADALLDLDDCRWGHVDALLSCGEGRRSNKDRRRRSFIYPAEAQV
jgi:hypothetical protein